MKELSKQLMGGSGATSKANKPVSDTLKTSKSKEDDRVTSEMPKQRKGSKSEATKGQREPNLDTKGATTEKETISRPKCGRFEHERRPCRNNRNHFEQE